MFLQKNVDFSKNEANTQHQKHPQFKGVIFMRIFLEKYIKPGQKTPKYHFNEILLKILFRNVFCWLTNLGDHF